MNELNKIFIYPGNLEVSRKPVQFTTILGSCVSICLWDSKLKIGGMNHYMLPLWNGDGLASPKYGNIAIDKLIQKMLQSGAQLSNLEAKIFGGGNIIQSSFSMYQIGDRNIEMAYSKLQEYGIEIIKSSTGGNLGRKILMDTGNFKILHKFIEKQNF